MLGQSPSFIFVHIPKTGGNSLQNILRTYSSDEIVTTAPHQDGMERFELRNQDYGFMKHSGLADYKAALPAATYAAAFKFCCVRNPWDRAISFYFSPHRNVTNFDRQDFLASLNDLTPMSYFMEVDRGQSTTAIGPNFDFIMRFETLQRDFDQVADELGFPRQVLPHRNASLRAPSESYYDQEMVDRVSDMFRQDIELSGYSPPIPKGKHG